MRLPHLVPGHNGPALAMLAVAVLVHLPAPRLAAQDPSQTFGWTAADREAIWKQQAEDATDNLEITGDDKSKLSALYLARRKILQEQLDALDSNSQNVKDVYGEYRRLVETERGRFRAALSDILDAKQVEAVAVSLGSFSRQWDRLLFAWRAIGLDPEKSKQGRLMIAAYIADWTQMREATPADDDTEHRIDELEQLKVGLDLSLATLLSDEQQTQWQQTTQFRTQRANIPGRRRR
ncbi:MAG: hypothetical protein IT365_03470 [Candidatus Hydrogenedentes bacterium]|nr:hypothetical protein [Candidatus Hydrogenedentota bacterium]